MRRITQAIVVVAGLMTASAQADSFIKPPETNAPQWNTPFPYQRNINMGFAINPAGAPGSGIPGAVYEGSLDPSLLISDAVTLSGSASWYGTLAGITSTGLIGIDNRTGSELLTGTVVFHINSTAQTGGAKNIWCEALTITGYNGAGAYLRVRDPLDAPAAQLGGGVNSYGDGWLSDYEFRFTPNPVYENIIWDFEVPAGTYIVLDNVHLATEYVPEPAAISLLALIAPAMLRRRRR